MAELFIPEPNPKQKLFLSATNRIVGYGGARGGGKSWTVRTKAILLCLSYPGIKCMIVRRTYPELFENHIQPLSEMLHCYDPNPNNRLARYNDSKKHILFPNGSRILFRYCENDKDAERFQGTEVDILFVDEATHQTEERLRKLNACVRGVNSFPKRIYYTCNPGGAGHAFIKRIFIDKKYNRRERPEDYTFIQALVDDNTALMEADPDYVDQLEALPEKLRKAWREGRWDVFEGQVFEEFTDDPKHYYDRRWTHVIEPFEIPETWKIYRGFDWGYTKPFSVGYYAIDFDGRMYRFSSIYGCIGEPNVGVRWETGKLAEEIKKHEQTHPFLAGRKIYGIADPAIWQEDGGISIAEAMANHGIYFDKGDHKRIPGKMQCHHRLRFDKEGLPMFYVFKSERDFIRTIPALIYSEKEAHIEDIDTTMEDHIYDEWRYVCMARPIIPEELWPYEEDDWQNKLMANNDDPLNLRSEPRYGEGGYAYRNII